MAFVLHWLKSIHSPEATDVDRVVLSLCFLGVSEVSIRHIKVAGNKKVPSYLRVDSLVIDKTLGEIGKEYWTEIVFETMLYETADDAWGMRRWLLI